MKQALVKILLGGILFSLSLVGISYAAGLPVSFVSQPSFPQNISDGQAVKETYTIRNNTPVTLPLTMSATASAGQLSIVSGGTCGTSIGPNVSCTVVAQFTPPLQVGKVTAELIIKYGGRYPLTGNMVFTGPSSSEILFGVTDDGSPSSPESLFTLDPTSGLATLFMHLGNGDTGEAIAADGSNLYHWSGYSSPIFERVNLNTKTVTNIPLTGTNSYEILGAVFFGGHFLTFSLGPSQTALYTNTLAGVVTLLQGNITFRARGMACRHGVVYAVTPGTDVLATFDPSTGNNTGFYHPITLPGFVVVGGDGITVNPKTGVFYAILHVASSSVRRLVTIDVNTLVATDIGPADNGSGLVFSGIAFYPADPTCS